MQPWGKIQNADKNRSTAFVSPVLLVPKAAISNLTTVRRSGRSSDLLPFLRPSRRRYHPVLWQWQYSQVAKRLLRSIQHREMSGILTWFPFNSTHDG